MIYLAQIEETVDALNKANEALFANGIFGALLIAFLVFMIVMLIFVRGQNQRQGKADELTNLLTNGLIAAKDEAANDYKEVGQAFRATESSIREHTEALREHTEATRQIRESVTRLVNETQGVVTGADIVIEEVTKTGKEVEAFRQQAQEALSHLQETALETRKVVAGHIHDEISPVVEGIRGIEDEFKNLSKLMKIGFVDEDMVAAIFSRMESKLDGYIPTIVDAIKNQAKETQDHETPIVEVPVVADGNPAVQPDHADSLRAN